MFWKINMFRFVYYGLSLFFKVYIKMLLKIKVLLEVDMELLFW